MPFTFSNYIENSVYLYQHSITFKIVLKYVWWVSGSTWGGGYIWTMYMAPTNPCNYELCPCDGGFSYIIFEKLFVVGAALFLGSTSGQFRRSFVCKIISSFLILVVTSVCTVVMQSILLFMEDSSRLGYLLVLGYCYGGVDYCLAWWTFCVITSLLLGSVSDQLRGQVPSDRPKLFLYPLPALTPHQSTLFSISRFRRKKVHCCILHY